MTTRRRFLTLLTTAALTLTLITTSSLVAGKGKPGGGGDPPPPPPVLYQVQFFDAPNGETIDNVYDTNNAGQTVGDYRIDLNGDGTFDSYRGYVYLPQVDAACVFDLSAIVTGMPDGWAVRKATAINTYGDIAAYIEPIASPGEFLQAVMIDMNGTEGTVHLVDDAHLTSYSLATGINDYGDIVVKYYREDGSYGQYVHNSGTYDPALATLRPIDLGVDAFSRWPTINNNFQVLGQYPDESIFLCTLVDFRGTETPSLAFENFSLAGASVGSLNDQGEFCGSIFVSSGKGKNNGQQYPYIMSSELEVFSFDTLLAWDINESSDIAGGDKILVHGAGLLDPIQLLDDSHTQLWSGIMTTSYSIRTMTDRGGVTNFPIVVGSGASRASGNIGFTLIPVAVPTQ